MNEYAFSAFIRHAAQPPDNWIKKSQEIMIAMNEVCYEAAELLKINPKEEQQEHWAQSVDLTNALGRLQRLQNGL